MIGAVRVGTATLVMLALAAPAAAATLQVKATGQVVSLADRTILSATVPGHGASPAEAQRNAAAMAEQLGRALAAAGVPAGAVTIDEPQSRFGFMGSPGFQGVVEGGSDPARPSFSASRQLTVKIDDPVLGKKARAVLLEQKTVPNLVPSVTYVLRDDAPAKQRALNDAVAKARGDAQALAAALGQRLGTVTRIANYPQAEAFDFGAIGDIYQALRQKPADAAPRTITTTTTVWLDFTTLPN